MVSVSKLKYYRKFNYNSFLFQRFVASWIEQRTSQTEQATLTYLFDKYVPLLLDTSKKFKRIAPITDIAMIQMTCYLLDCLLPNELPACPSETGDWHELYFVFAIIWGFGSTLCQDQLIDWRIEFSRFWTTEFKAIRFPTDSNVFNYYIEPKSGRLCPWSELVPSFELDTEVPLQVIFEILF